MPTVIFLVVIISSTPEERKANATLQPKSWENFSKVSLTLSFLEQLAVFTFYILTHLSPQVLQDLSLYTFSKIF